MWQGFKCILSHPFLWCGISLWLNLLPFSRFYNFSNIKLLYFVVIIYHFIFQLRRRQSLSFGDFFLLCLLLSCLDFVGAWLKFFYRYGLVVFLIYMVYGILCNLNPIFFSNLTLFFCLDFNTMVRGKIKMDVKKETYGRYLFFFFYFIWILANLNCY